MITAALTLVGLSALWLITGMALAAFLERSERRDHKMAQPSTSSSQL